MTTIAHLRNVSKVFDRTKAVDSINVEVHEGETMALLGPNGSGKTTLLKILALIERPTSGEVYFGNRKVTDENVEQLRLESTMVFQKTMVFNLTVFDNVAYGLNVRKIPKEKIQKDVSETLELVKLEGFENRKARELSGGEQQRVAIARALVIKTKLLLLDEPTANLDPKNASIVEEIISKVTKETGTTIVMATHNMFQAKQLPTRIGLMSNGQITEVGTPSEIFGKLSKTLASFGAVENTFKGEAETAEEGTTLIDIGNNVRLQTAAQCRGQVNVFIAPADIILSRTRLESSARNTFKGKILEISDLDSLVKLKVNVGKPFTVQITKRSFTEMGLNINSEVFLAFKASNVQVI